MDNRFRNLNYFPPSEIGNTNTRITITKYPQAKKTTKVRRKKIRRAAEDVRTSQGEGSVFGVWLTVCLSCWGSFAEHNITCTSGATPGSYMPHYFIFILCCTQAHTLFLTTIIWSQLNDPLLFPLSQCESKMRASISLSDTKFISEQH